MSLAVDVRVRAGDFRLTAAFESDARVTALFGPSGAGKTTLLNAVAGLLRPEAGRIVVDGAVLFDAAERIDVPSHRRRLGYVFQDGRLFPHLRVRGNLLYGRRFAAGLEARPELDAVVELLALRPLLHRWPATLSGGERQRVALGRALLAGPRALLLDEPFASLDAARKAELIPYVERLRDDLRVPMLLVSHDRAEVDRLAGKVIEVGVSAPTASA